MTEIRIVILSCCFTAPEKVLPMSSKKINAKIKKDFPSAEVVKSFFVVDKSKLLPNFKLAILETKKHKCLLVIDEFAPFQRNLKALSFLKSHRVNFKFLELQYLKKGVTLDCLLECLELTKKVKGKKISHRIKERQANGHSQGLGVLKKKKVKEVILMANYAKRFNAFFNMEAKEARTRITILRETGLSYRKIAEQINKEKFTTPKGNSFGSKTVERYYDYQQKLALACTPSEYWKIELSGLMNNQKDSTPFKVIGFEAGQNVHDILSFKIIEKTKTAFQINIYNHKDEDPIFVEDSRKVSKASTNKELTIEVNLKKLQRLFPGIYFLEIESSKDHMILPFYFYKEILPESALHNLAI